ncbi:MAG: hypothetical protein AAFU79_18775, partial [Myxococcota bacterium]
MASKYPRYGERVLALAEQDPELGRHRPIAEAFRGLCRVERPLGDRVDAVFEAYGDRPALRERSYAVTEDASGRRVRTY